MSQIRLQQRYLAIQELHKEEQIPVIILCEVAKISRAAYYKWCVRTSSKREQENEELLEGIRLLYDQVDGIYGYRRMTMTINRYRKVAGLPTYNEKRIYRLMNIYRIQSVIRRKRKGYKKSIPQHVAENLLNRNFKADAPNEKWCTDITEFKYGVGRKAYLSAIIDLHDGSIVGYKLGKSNNNHLVFDTIIPVIEQLPPSNSPMIHSDRGFQYTSKGFKRIVDGAKMTHSMFSSWSLFRQRSYREFLGYTEIGNVLFT